MPGTCVMSVSHAAPSATAIAEIEPAAVTVTAFCTGSSLAPGV